VALAAKVRLSPAACLRRGDRLKSMGSVQRIVALLNPASLTLACRS
jgi:DNA-binding Lrp family transcriptional regulator